MKEIRLDGDKMVDKASAHAYLKRELALPDYYGENLDALWDCLSTEASLMRITICKSEAIIKHLGSYGEAIVDLFQQSAEENRKIQVYIERDNGI